jgi:molybdopterin converting factor small subunit
VITIDVVKSIIEEVNIHNESPSVFMDVFNVKKITGKYTVTKLTETKGGEIIEEVLHKGVKIYPREFDEDYVGRYFEVDGDYIGQITKVMDADVIAIKPSKRGAKEIILKISDYNSIHKNFKYKNFEPFVF